MVVTRCFRRPSEAYRTLRQAAHQSRPGAHSSAAVHLSAVNGAMVFESCEGREARNRSTISRSFRQHEPLRQVRNGPFCRTRDPAQLRDYCMQAAIMAVICVEQASSAVHGSEAASRQAP